MNLYRLDPKILLLGEHSYLDATDECYFTDVYQCHHGTGIKSMVLALKHGREPLVSSIAAQLAALLPLAWAIAYTFVPMPSSGSASGVRAMVKQLPVSDCRDLLMQHGETPASHAGWRTTPRQRQDLLAINELVADPRPERVVVVDDVLTTGAHFRAAKQVIRDRWRNIRVIGLFLARVGLRARNTCAESANGAWPDCSRPQDLF